jgi:hypothetical protein
MMPIIHRFLRYQTLLNRLLCEKHFAHVEAELPCAR